MAVAARRRGGWAASAIVLATSPALADTAQKHVEEVITAHGWPCGKVIELREVRAHEYLAECDNGQRYTVELGPAGDVAASTRQTALQPLIQLGNETRRLASRDASERRVAAEQLAAMGPSARLAAGSLTLALRDPDPAVRVASAEALGAIHATDPATLAALEKALGDQDSGVAAAAADALRTLHGN